MTAINTFIEQLDAIPWFANLGKASARDRDVLRVYHWETWPGPEDPGSEMQAAFLLRWHDDLFNATPPSAGLRDAWEAVHDRVLRLTKATVGYDENKDVWFGPNAAVEQAAYTAALVGCTILKEGGLTEIGDPRSQWTLSNEWSWYRAGHWPCMYYWPWGHADIAVAYRTGGAKRLVVY